MTDTENRCGTCKHFRSECPENAQSHGFCLRYPPRSKMTKSGPNSYFPFVKNFWRCGEWTPV